VSRTCRECGATEGEFVADKANICLLCKRAKSRAWYRANKVKALAASAIYQRANAGRGREMAKARRLANPGVEAEYQRTKRAVDPDAARAREKDSRERRRGPIKVYKAAQHKAHPEVQLEKTKSTQRETLPTADRSGFEWAGWEFELVSDYGRSARALARQLGRTYYAVQAARKLLRNDPKTIERAGLSKSGIL